MARTLHRLSPTKVAGAKTLAISLTAAISTFVSPSAPRRREQEAHSEQGLDFSVHHGRQNPRCRPHYTRVAGHRFEGLWT